ncbi:MAG: hypothetical protein ACRDR6_27845 [Pseudonocardiaceae bacterium]
MSETILTKALRDGRTVNISIIPDADSGDDEVTTLGWWLLFVDQDGNQLGRMKARPRELPTQAAPGLTHAVSVKHNTSIGLTSAEAAQVHTAIEQWVDGRKQAAHNARKELARRVRAAAPDAPTWIVSDPYGVPGVGENRRLDDGRIITGLRVWNRYYSEDGMVFGAATDAGYVYFAEVRAATAAEAVPLLEAEAAQRHRKELLARADAEIVTPATRPGDAETIPELLALPEVQLDSLTGLRRAEQHLWVLRYNGADGDNWALSNYRAYIATRVPLTQAREDLFTQLAAVGVA